MVFLEDILKKTQIPLQDNFAGFGVLRIPILIEEWVADLVRHRAAACPRPQRFQRNDGSENRATRSAVTKNGRGGGEC